MKDPK